MTEASIRELMQKDPEQGSAALFKTYYPYVYTIVSGIIRDCGSREDIEDCVMEVLHDVQSKFLTIHEGTLKSYIIAAARNKAYSAYKRLSAFESKTISMDEEDFPELASQQDITQEAEQKELLQRVLDCIEELGQPDAAILLQRHYYDRNAAEIGQALGMNPVTVRSRLNRAMKRLRKRLKEEGISL